MLNLGFMLFGAGFDVYREHDLENDSRQGRSIMGDTFVWRSTTDGRFCLPVSPTLIRNQFDPVFNLGEFGFRK